MVCIGSISEELPEDKQKKRQTTDGYCIRFCSVFAVYKFGPHH